MKRHNFLKTINAGIIAGQASLLHAKKDTRPNIIWIVAEDMSCHFSYNGEKTIMTPNVDWLGAEGAVFLASGMGATALAHLAVLRPGDHLLASAWIYGGTRTLLDEELGRFGIEVTYVDPTQARHWRTSLRDNTRAIFIAAEQLDIDAIICSHQSREVFRSNRVLICNQWKR